MSFIDITAAIKLTVCRAFQHQNSTLVGFSRAQFNDAYFWSHSNCAFGYGLHTAFHGGTYRALYASRRSRCDSSDRAVELCAVCAVQFSRLAGRQCGYLRFLSEPPLYFSSFFLFCLNSARESAMSHRPCDSKEDTGAACSLGWETPRP